MASDSIGEGADLDDGRRFAGAVGPLIDRMVRVARRILKSDDLAWEAVQEALFGLWQLGHAPPNLHSWMVRAVVHRSLHLRRTLLRRQEHEARASRTRCESSDLDDPVRRLLDEESRSELRDALARLALHHREVILLHLWEGLDYVEIAARLDIPVGTVRSRLNRARDALRASMARRREEDE